MIKRYAILILVLVWGMALSAQGQFGPAYHCDPLPNHTTNPDSPNTLNTFDWRAPRYKLFINRFSRNNFCIDEDTTVASPFFRESLDNLRHLQSAPGIKDFKSEDGWELVYAYLGSREWRIEQPSLSLYNKYISTLRIFFLLPGGITSWPLSPRYRNALLTLQFGGNETSILAHVESPSQSLRNKTPHIVRVTHLKFDDGLCNNWFVADIPLAYDPCSCQFESFFIGGLRLELDPFYPNDTNNIESMFLSVHNRNMNSASVIANRVSAYTNHYTTISEVTDRITSEEVTPTLSSALSDASPEVTANYTQDLVSIKAYEAIAGPVRLLTTGPHVWNPPAITHQPHLRGGINRIVNYTFLSVASPGLVPLTPRLPRNWLPPDLPTYNNILGNFHMMDLPELDVYSYKPPIREIRYVGRKGRQHRPCRVTGNEVLPEVHEFQVNQTAFNSYLFKLLHNPANGLKVHRVRAAFVYTPTDLNGETHYGKSQEQDSWMSLQRRPRLGFGDRFYGPIPTLGQLTGTFSDEPHGNGHNDRFNYSAMKLVSNPTPEGYLDQCTFSTDFVDLDALDKLVFRIYDQGRAPWTDKLAMRLIIQYSFPERDSLYTSILTYKIKINPVVSTGRTYQLALFGERHATLPTGRKGSKREQCPEVTTDGPPYRIDSTLSTRNGAWFYWDHDAPRVYALPATQWSQRVMTADGINLEQIPRRITLSGSQVTDHVIAREQIDITGTVTASEGIAWRLRAPRITVAPSVALPVGVDLIQDESLGSLTTIGFRKHLMSGNHLRNFCRNSYLYDPSPGPLKPTIPLLPPNLKLFRTLYPNPSRRQGGIATATILFTRPFTDTEVSQFEIYDALGRPSPLIKRIEGDQLHVETSAPPGVYQIRLRTPTESHTLRWVIVD